MGVEKREGRNTYKKYKTNSSPTCDLIHPSLPPSLPAGPPEILLHNDTYLRDTVQDLTVEGIIRGFPSPRVLLMREVNDEFRPLVDPRFEITFDNISATVSITIRGVRKADGGRYRVDAINSQGTDNETFTLIPRGELDVMVWEKE